MIFSSFNCLGRFLAALLSSLAFGISYGAETGRWESLLEKNPFGGAPGAVAAAPTGGLEFRGVVQEDGVYLVNLYDPTTKSSQWLPVKGSAAGLTVNGYDESDGKLSITQGGKQMELEMKQPTVALMNAPVPQPAQGVVTLSRGGPTPGRPGGSGRPQFSRTLPPETQAMIEEIRRRRAQRQQAMQQNAANQGGNRNAPAQQPGSGGPRRFNPQRSSNSNR